MGWALPAAMIGSSLISAFSNRGRDQKLKKLPTMSPEQQARFNQMINNPIENSGLYKSGSNYLQQILSNDPAAFAAFENPLMQQFQQQIVPQIAEQFAGIGGLSSSGFQNQLGEAAKGLSTNLAALRGQLQQNALGQALQYAQQPYSNVFAQSQIPTFAYGNQQQSQNPFAAFATPLAQGVGQGIGTNWASSLFGGMNNQNNPNNLANIFGQMGGHAGAQQG